MITMTDKYISKREAQSLLSNLYQVSLYLVLSFILQLKIFGALNRLG